MKKFLCGILMLTIALTAMHGAASAQATTEDTDFWVAWLVNGGYQMPKEQRLIAVGDNACDIHIDNDLAGIHMKSHLSANGSVEILLPAAAALPMVSGSPASNAFHVTSTAPIALYAVNSQMASSSMTQVLPTSKLDTLYVVQDYPGDYSRTSTSGAEVIVVATTDSTELTVVLTGPTAGTGLAGDDTLRMTLNRGQSLLLDTPPPYSFSGMHVKANHPIALFQGNKITGIPHAMPGGDMLYEQAIPLRDWGTDFVAASTPGRSTGDYLRITAAFDLTRIRISGQNAEVTLHAGETHEWQLPAEGACRIMSNLPVGVSLFQVSSTSVHEAGDCSQLSVPQTGHGVNRAVFATPNIKSVSHHRVGIIVNTSHAATTILDGDSIGNWFFPVDSIYSHAAVAIAPGRHVLENTEGTFQATLYGISDMESYACNIGMTFDTVAQQIVAIDLPIIHDTIHLYDTICQGMAYDRMGLTASATETDESQFLMLEDSIRLGDTVIHRQLHLTIRPDIVNEMTINIIAGDTLYFNDTTLTVAGQYFFTLSAANGCDSIVKLHLDYEGVGINASPVGVCPGQMATLTTQGTHAARWQSLPEDPELATQQGRSVVRVHPRTTTTYFLLDNLGNIIASTIVGAEPAPRPCMDIQREVVGDQPQVTLQDCSVGSDFTVWRFSDGVRQTGSRMRREFEDPLPDNVTVKMTTCNSFNCCTDTSATLNLQVQTVWFPVSFNPTDGRNLFGCATSCEVEEFEIEVFSRMGLLLWSSNDINSQWDGSFRGIALPEGSYLYRWHLKEKNGKEQSDCGAVRLER